MNRAAFLAFHSMILAFGPGVLAADAGVPPATTSPRDDSTAWARAFGAAGDGIADDTDAIARALASGKTVRCTAGDVHLVSGGLVASTAAQTVDFSGCTLRLRSGARATGILRVAGKRARIVGGDWDLNASGNPGDRDHGYSTWAVLVDADHVDVERVFVHDSAGIGIKIRGGVNYAVVRANHTRATRVWGIFADGSAASDSEGIRIENNLVEYVTTTGMGIGLYAKEDPRTGVFTHDVRGFAVDGNTVLAPSTGQDPDSVAITVRGINGTVRGNTTRGAGIGISVDRQSPSSVVVSGNHVTDTSVIGIEINGGDSTVMSNFVAVRSGTGIEGSSNASARPGDSLDSTIIQGNVIKGSTRFGIRFHPADHFTARFLVISANVVEVRNGSCGIHLSGDSRFATIAGNTLLGPGSAVAMGRGIYLDAVNSDVAIRGNRFVGWERTVGLYSRSAIAQQRISFEGNDVSADIPHTGTSLLNLEGAASFGPGVRIVGNFTGSASTYREDYYDVANRVSSSFGNHTNDPEGVLPAGIGSMWCTSNPGQAHVCYVKQSGATARTGWKAVATQ